MHFAKTPMRAVVASLVGAILCSTDAAASAQEPLKLAGSQLEPVKWTDSRAGPLMITSPHLQPIRQAAEPCAKGTLTTTDRSMAPCRTSATKPRPVAAGLGRPPASSSKRIFNLCASPAWVRAEGLVTGYFEPIVQGSRFPSPEFHVPLYRRPRDLVVAGHKPGSDAFPNKGVRIGRPQREEPARTVLRPGAIEAGALDGQKLEICWLKDPFDLLAIQIEGSGRVILEDGTPLRINYDSHNGYSFTSTQSRPHRTRSHSARRDVDAAYSRMDDRQCG